MEPAKLSEKSRFLKKRVSPTFWERGGAQLLFDENNGCKVMPKSQGLPLRPYGGGGFRAKNPLAFLVNLLFPGHFFLSSFLDQIRSSTLNKFQYKEYNIDVFLTNKI